MKLAALPKLRRIGLVKCSSISDRSVHALARANNRSRALGHREEAGWMGSNLERVHLSYCTNLTLNVSREGPCQLNFCVHRLTDESRASLSYLTIA
jgi:hypothetical protein